ncbi:MAG TPA: HD domain-containing protein, partial [Phormidium sp.]
MNNRLTQQIQFITEIDKLKNILRQTKLTDNSRQENSAEHSWHLAIMAIILAEYAVPDSPTVVLMSGFSSDSSSAAASLMGKTVE